MLAKKYIKKAYILEAYCDKCGSKMESTGMVYNTLPEQYLFRCSNQNCDEYTTFWPHAVPGKIHYEFEEDENV